jgi:hypothetical protein
MEDRFAGEGKRWKLIDADSWRHVWIEGIVP